MTSEKAEPVQRSVTLDVYAPDEKRQAVLDSIRKYRAVCRQVYATLLLGQTAGAALEEKDDVGPRLRPNGDGSKICLAAALGSAQIERQEPKGERGQGQAFKVRVGSVLAYELRSYVRQNLWPTSYSFVWDSIRRDVATVWTSADPEHTKAKRGWLALQGARDVARFNYRGIGFPIVTARPRLEGDTLTLKWDTEMEAVEFKLPKLDGGRYWVWKNLRDKTEGWKLGTLYLNERGGRIRVTLSHSKPAQTAELDPERVCTVRVGEGASGSTEATSDLFRIGGSGVHEEDAIGKADVIGWLKRHEARRQALEAQRAACGNPRRPWGRCKGWKAVQAILSRVTQGRTNGVKDYNHDWTRRIITRAIGWRCGKIHLKVLPENLCGYPWAWSQFVDFLKYKAKEKGIEVIVET